MNRRFRVAFAIWCTAGIAVFCTSALASVNGATADLPSSPVSPLGILQVLVGLAVVLAAIVGTAWALRRLAPGQGRVGGVLKLVGGLMVGPKERVVLLEIGETWLVLGVAPGQVTALHAMEKPARAEAADSVSEPEHGFAHRLLKAMGRGNQKD